ncbi:MFS transporter [Halomonas sp. M20]|uniref:MFS transporter n=1 Tax=Halomonas sp. M20 TaxID=2763264 RepID=UPI001D0AAEF6|nr:MFS transporter [Halomonas sp. M20]
MASLPSRSRPLLFVALMILVALNLRPALSSMAPLLIRIQQELGLSASAIGALTTLPVLCLGLFAPLALRLSSRLGAERALSLGLLLLVFALILRATNNIPLLYLGTLLAGAAIGIAGTLLPGLVKRELPQGADVVTGVYTMALCLGGALGAGLTVPLSNWLGDWRFGLGSWALLALLALTAWRLSMPHPRSGIGGHTQLQHPKPRLMRSMLAWQVTGYMGCQSSLAYIVFGWLPVLLQHRGLDESEAGWLLATSITCQLATALGAPWLARLGRDQRPTILLLMSMTAAGIALLLLAPLNWRWLGALLLGMGQGGCFSMALTLIVLRTGTSELASQLSSMAQGFGYVLAATGPLMVGILLEYTQDMRLLATVLLVYVALATNFALLAGRQRRLELDTQGQLVTIAH